MKCILLLIPLAIIYSCSFYSREQGDERVVVYWEFRRVKTSVDTLTEEFSFDFIDKLLTSEEFLWTKKILDDLGSYYKVGKDSSILLPQYLYSTMSSLGELDNLLEVEMQKKLKRQDISSVIDRENNRQKGL